MARARGTSPPDPSLLLSLRAILRRPRDFGGGIFALAATMLSEQIHNEPTAYPQLEAAGLPEAFLGSLVAGVLPSAEAIACIPPTLTALCLHHAGLQRVTSAKALPRCLLPLFTHRAYAKAMQGGELVATLGAGLEELTRHVPGMREPCVAAAVDVVRAVCRLGGAEVEASPAEAEAEAGAGAGAGAAGAGAGAGAAPVPMEVSEPTPAAASTSAAASAPAAPPDDPESRDREADAEMAHLNDCMSHVGKLLESLLASPESARIFVERGGVDLARRALLLGFGWLVACLLACWLAGWLAGWLACFVLFCCCCLPSDPLARGSCA